MNRATARALALSAIAVLAGCNGGGGTAPASPQHSGGTSGPTAAKKVTVSITFSTARATAARTPSIARHPDFISPATLGAVVTATSTTPANQAANDARYGFDLSTNNRNCTYNVLGGSVDCTLAIPLAIDTYSIEVDTYDQNDSALPANLGTELSTDTEPETVSASASANVFTFNPHAFVAGFAFFTTRSSGGSAGRHVSSTRRPQATASPLPGVVAGADGGTSNSVANPTLALDRDGYEIDSYPGVTTFANGTFVVSVAEPADTTGCTAAAPCMSVTNVNGTSYGPEKPSTTPATIPQPVPSAENFTMNYSGGGSIGTGVIAWNAPSPVPSATPAAAPSGTRPYYADVSIPDPSGGAIAPYLVPHAYVAPLFGYASNGNGTPFVGPATGENVYVWAAQALIPTGLPPNGSAYVATFTGGGPTCTDANNNTIATVQASTFYAGYGRVFTIATSEGPSATNCTLTLNDGAGDSQTVTISVAMAPSSVIRRSSERRSLRGNSR